LIPLAISFSLGACGRVGGLAGVVGVWPPFPVIDLDRMPGAGSPDLAMEEIPETLGFGIPGVGSCDMLVSVCGLVQEEVQFK
jgi:hypothetical protein